MIMSEMSEDSKLDTKYNLKIYWGVLRNYKILIFGIIFFVFIIEVANIFDRFLFKIIIDKGTEFVASSLPRALFVQILIMVAVAFVFNFLIRSVVRWLNIHFVNILEGKIILDIKKKFLNHLVQLSYNFYTTHKTGSLISKLIRSGSAVERMSDTFVFNFFPLFFQLVVVLTTIVLFDTASAVIILFTAVAFVTFSLIINKSMQRANMRANNAEDFEKGQISDIFTNIESIKYFGKEENIKKKYKGIGEETQRLVVKAWDYYRWQSAGNGILLGIATLLIIYFPVVKLLNGQITIGTLVFIYTVYGQLLQYLFGFDNGIRGYYRSIADFDSLFRYYKIENDIADPPNAKPLKIKEGTIEFRNVSFSFKKRQIFRNFSLKIPKNKKIAIVGPSGAGKTSLVRLIYRFYDVEQGEILIDGKNIKEFKQETLRGELSIVPQECVLFDDTIYNNVAFSRPEASRKEVLAAMKFAQLDKIVREFPNNESTIVGERGVKLSGGEKQRVSIARAILANKKILVLDEATSSLDSETESEIQKDLYRLMEGRTNIIIAHRLSTIMKADMIVVLENGTIAQIGNHKELIGRKGLYQKLWGLQKGGYLR
jgi:ATP-binding cassette, subfamily B, heavy metal transporter